MAIHKATVDKDKLLSIKQLVLLIDVSLSDDDSMVFSQWSSCGFLGSGVGSSQALTSRACEVRKSGFIS